MGYAPKLCGGSGVVATVGKAGGKTILLRSDMDALPMREESGLPFASTCDAYNIIPETAQLQGSIRTDSPGQFAVPDLKATASDDFACVLERIPGAYIYLSAGFADRPATQQHSPDVLFNEEVFRFGPAYLAHCATRWLEDAAKKSL